MYVFKSVCSRLFLDVPNAVTVTSLQTSLEGVNNEVEQLKQSQLLEVNQVRRQLSSEQDKVVTELRTQIRQLTLEREEALAQVIIRYVYTY